MHNQMSAAFKWTCSQLAPALSLLLAVSACVQDNPPAVTSLQQPAPVTLQSAGKFDGTWYGQLGLWHVTLKVTGSKGELTLNCIEQFKFDIDVSADGLIDTYIRGQRFDRRHIGGELPNFVLAPGGYCSGGQGKLRRQ